MKALKEKTIAISGAISTFIGGIGIAIAELGLCACVLAPILSLAGVISLAMGFLSQNRLYFLTGGIVLLLVSYLFYKRKKTCKIHKNQKFK